MRVVAGGLAVEGSTGRVARRSVACSRVVAWLRVVTGGGVDFLSSS